MEKRRDIDVGLLLWTKSGRILMGKPEKVNGVRIREERIFYNFVGKR